MTGTACPLRPRSAAGIIDKPCFTHPYVKECTMKKPSKHRSRRATPPGPKLIRPQIEFMEERLQPGDAVLGGLWGVALLGENLAVLDPVAGATAPARHA